MSRFVRPALIVVLFLVAGPLQLGAQRWMADSAKVLSASAEAAQKQGNRAGLERAASLWTQSAELYRRGGDRRGQGDAVHGVGSAYHALGRGDSAMALYRQALQLRSNTGDRLGVATTLSNLAILYRTRGQIDSAMAHHRRALSIRREAKDRAGEGQSLNGIGIIHHETGQPDSAFVYYRQVLAIAQETKDRRAEAQAWGNIGIVHRTVGHPDSALAAQQRVLQIVRELSDQGLEGNILNSIAISHRTLGRPDSALIYAGRALHVQRSRGDRRAEGYALISVANAHRSLDQFDSATAYYRKAMDSARDVGDRRLQGVAFGSLADTYVDGGQADSALVYLQYGLVVSREIGDRSGENSAHFSMGRLYADAGRPDSAKAHFRLSLEGSRNLGERTQESRLLAELAKLYRLHPTLGATREAANAHYDSAAAVRAAVATRAGSDANRVSFTEQDAGLFVGWSLAWLARAPEIGAKPAALASLAAAERGRSQALLALLRSATPAETAASAPAPKPGADMVAEGRALLAAVHRPGTAIVSYALAEDTLLTWLVLPSGEVSVKRQPATRDSIALLVTDFRAGLGADSALTRGRGRQANGQSARGEHDRGAGRLLADLLLPPALRRLPDGTEVIIVPQGALNLVPFAALPQGRRGTYGERFALRYAPSLATLAETERRPALAAARRDELRRALVAGNPVMPEMEPADAEAAPAAVLVMRGRGTRLEPLPAAEAEARQVATRFGAPLLTGAEASETRIRRELATAPLVHLATHGIVYSSDARVRQSFLALAPDSLHDGRLTVGEVIDEGPVLSAELVVLSACQTGLGNLRQAEGTVGLQRAFLARGARGVLVSLWSVSDEATGLLMQYFYQHWLDDRDGPSKAEALRRAQADVRRVPRFSEPLYWAAFQLVGAR